MTYRPEYRPGDILIKEHEDGPDIFQIVRMGDKVRVRQLRTYNVFLRGKEYEFALSYLEGSRYMTFEERRLL
jgi:hypothetical protein